jgi:hypothetical protein
MRMQFRDKTGFSIDSSYFEFERKLLEEDEECPVEKLAAQARARNNGMSPVEDDQESLTPIEKFKRSSDLRWGRKTQVDISLESLERNTRPIKIEHEEEAASIHAQEAAELRKRTGDRSPIQEFAAASKARWFPNSVVRTADANPTPIQRFVAAGKATYKQRWFSSGDPTRP